MWVNQREHTSSTEKLGRFLRDRQPACSCDFPRLTSQLYSNTFNSRGEKREISIKMYEDSQPDSRVHIDLHDLFPRQNRYRFEEAASSSDPYRVSMLQISLKSRILECRFKIRFH